MDENGHRRIASLFAQGVMYVLLLGVVGSCIAQSQGGSSLPEDATASAEEGESTSTGRKPSQREDIVAMVTDLNRDTHDFYEKAWSRLAWTITVVGSIGAALMAFVGCFVPIYLHRQYKAEINRLYENKLERVQEHAARELARVKGEWVRSFDKERLLILSHMHYQQAEQHFMQKEHHGVGFTYLLQAASCSLEGRDPELALTQLNEINRTLADQEKSRRVMTHFASYPDHLLFLERVERNLVAYPDIDMRLKQYEEVIRKFKHYLGKFDEDKGATEAEDDAEA